MVGLPVFRSFNLCTKSPAGNRTWGLHGHHGRVGTECRLWEKNPLPHQGLEPVSVSCLGVSVRRSADRAVPVPPILSPWQRSRLTYAARHNDLTLAPLILCHGGPLRVSLCSHTQISCFRTCFVVHSVLQTWFCLNCRNLCVWEVKLQMSVGKWVLRQWSRQVLLP